MKIWCSCIEPCVPNFEEARKAYRFEAYLEDRLSNPLFMPEHTHNASDSGKTDKLSLIGDIRRNIRYRKGYGISDWDFAEAGR